MQFEVRAAQKAQTYHKDRQAFEQRITKKCAKDGDFAKVSNRIIGVVHIPNRNPDTFGVDIKEMTTKNLTLTEVQNSGAFGLMPRQRLRTVQRDLYSQLDKIPFLATAGASEEDA